MIEFSLTEIALLVWAVASTAGWMQSRDELRGAKRMLRAMIEDEDVRNKIVNAFSEFKRSES